MWKEVATQIGVFRRALIGDGIERAQCVVDMAGMAHHERNFADTFEKTRDHRVETLTRGEVPHATETVVCGNLSRTNTPSEIRTERVDHEGTQRRRAAQDRRPWFAANSHISAMRADPPLERVQDERTDMGKLMRMVMPVDKGGRAVEGVLESVDLAFDLIAQLVAQLGFAELAGEAGHDQARVRR